MNAQETAKKTCRDGASAALVSQRAPLFRARVRKNLSSASKTPPELDSDEAGAPNEDIFLALRLAALATRCLLGWFLHHGLGPVGEGPEAPELRQKTFERRPVAHLKDHDVQVGVLDGEIRMIAEVLARGRGSYHDMRGIAGDQHNLPASTSNRFLHDHGRPCFFHLVHLHHADVEAHAVMVLLTARWHLRQRLLRGTNGYIKSFKHIARKRSSVHFAH